MFASSMCCDMTLPFMKIPKRSRKGKEEDRGEMTIEGKNAATNRMVPRVKKLANYRLPCVTLILVDLLGQN